MSLVTGCQHPVRARSIGGDPLDHVHEAVHLDPTEAFDLGSGSVGQPLELFDVAVRPVAADPATASSARRRRDRLVSDLSELDPRPLHPSLDEARRAPRRRSSVSGGTNSRIAVPSMVGVRPMSLWAMAATDRRGASLGSQGWIRIWRGSGTRCSPADRATHGCRRARSTTPRRVTPRHGRSAGAGSPVPSPRSTRRILRSIDARISALIGDPSAATPRPAASTLR